jgi:hypothetical protein
MIEKPGPQGPGFFLVVFLAVFLGGLPGIGDLVPPVTQGMLRNFSTAPA